MKPVSTTRAAICRSSLLLGTCLLGALALGGCFSRQPGGRGGEPLPPAEGALPPPADSSTAETPRGPKAEAPAPAAPAAEAVSPGNRAYTATAYLRVAREEPYVVFPATGGDARADYASYKATQMQLMKARFVLAAAARKPEVEGLACLRRGPARRDPAGWLAEQLHVDSPGDAEIVRVSLSSDDAESAAALLNAVVNAYLEEAATMEQGQRSRRLDQVDHLYAEKEEELRTIRNLMRRLAERVGNPETPESSVRQQFTLEEALDARKELSAARSDLRRAQAERKADEAMLANPASTDVPDQEVDALAQNDPLIGQVLMPLVAELKKQLLGATGDAARQAEGKLKAVQGEINTRRDELRRGQVARKRAALEADLGRLQTQCDALAVVVNDCEDTLRRARNEALHARDTSLDVSVMQDKVALMQEVVRAVAGQRERLRIEINAPPRVTLLKAAELPEKKDTTDRSL
jgi:hypothetical protein